MTMSEVVVARATARRRPSAENAKPFTVYLSVKCVSACGAPPPIGCTQTFFGSARDVSTKPRPSGVKGPWTVAPAGRTFVQSWRSQSTTTCLSSTNAPVRPSCEIVNCTAEARGPSWRGGPPANGIDQSVPPFVEVKYTVWPSADSTGAKISGCWTLPFGSRRNECGGACSPGLSP
jgi:hypothetical protein